MITPAQCRAARGLLKWTQEELAVRSGVGAPAIINFEGGKTSPHKATLKVLRETCEKAGVIFIESDTEAGPGVRLRKPDS